MNKTVLSGSVLTLSLTTFSLPSRSQAIAESVMLGAGSLTAAVKAGSALNSALNQSGSQLAGRIQQQVLATANAATANEDAERKNLAAEESTSHT